MSRLVWQADHMKTTQAMKSSKVQHSWLGTDTRSTGRVSTWEIPALRRLVMYSTRGTVVHAPLVSHKVLNRRGKLPP